jgi:hypothetical protein
VATREAEALLVLMEEVGTLYEKLAVLTEAFLCAARGGLPDESSQDAFWQGRASLVEQLPPLLERQRVLFDRDEAADQVAIGKASDLQLRRMQRVEALDAQLVQELAAMQARIAEQLTSIRQGKKGLAGYQVDQKVSPRFCRKTT